jgi:hypothetical protein
MRSLHEPFDGGNHTARIFRLTAVRKELLALAGRTKFAIENVIAVQTCLFHLSTVGLGEINSPAAPDLLPFGEIGRKLLRNFDTDFITAVANTGSYSGIDIAGSRTEISRHLLNRATNNSGDRSAPSRMNSAHRPMAAVKQKDGHTIGSTDANALACFVRYQGIALAFAIPQAIRVEDMRGVNLAKSNINFRTTPTRAEAVLLPDKLPKGITTVDSVRPEPERVAHRFELRNQLSVRLDASFLTLEVGPVPFES